MTASDERTTRTRVVIIGAGPGGICTGHHLLEAGIDDFVILEQADGAGGTWWRNRYPGLACDVPSHLYSFSFRLKPDWSRPYADQPEILDYVLECVEEFGLWPFIRLQTAVQSARWDDDTATWTVHTSTGETFVADVVVSGIGMFGAAKWPQIDGIETFRGTSFHTSQWRTDHPLDGERVAVIGSAASAVQLVPEVARQAAQLHLFQRSANWVLPKEDAPFTEEQLERFRRDRAAVEAVRDEVLGRIGPSKPFANEEMRRMCEAAGLANIAVVEDEELRRRLTPDVPWGCQRPLFSNVYYPTFNRPDVELVTDPIVRISPDGVVTADGTERVVDTIVYATGYETTRYVSAIDVVGRGGVAIDEAWSDGAVAFFGVSTSGFPNLFMLYGPNTNQGSLIWMIEQQVEFAVRAVLEMERRGIAALDVRPEAMAAHNEVLQCELDEVTVWDAGCSQYYRVPSGRIVTQWPHSMFAYRDRLRAVDLDRDYELIPR